MSNITVYQSVSVAHDQVWCVEGHDPAFRPGQFLSPDLFLAVNPYGYEDNEAKPSLEDMRDEMFWDPDAAFFLVDASLCDLQHALFKQAKLDAQDHFECSNGGLYALWAVGPHQVLIAGMDNGGSDMAVTAAHDVAHEFKGTLVHEEAHFNFLNAQDTGCALLPLVEQIKAFRQSRRLTRHIEEANPNTDSTVSKPHKI